MSELYPVLSVRLFSDEKCFGPGVAVLLEKIDETSSLRSAATKLDMSYSKAWSIIKRAQNHLGLSLIESKTGGHNGGGAELTEHGRHILASYREYEKFLKNTATEQFSEYFSWIDKE